MDINKLCPHCMKDGLTEEGICRFCGCNLIKANQVKHQLKPFTILNGKYLVGTVLGEGGFGITYIGLDINLEIKVAIKEFYPNGFATREATVSNELTIYSGSNLETVEKWRDNFIKEARSLAKCSNMPGIVGVKEFFTENQTAYIVLEYLEGQTLKEYTKSMGGKISAEQLLPPLMPIFDALDAVHKEGIIHRDISPDNIMLLNNGRMKLLDFGAARDYTSAGEKSLSVMLKPGYAPEEQYRTKGQQGPWSDVYALAGTIYKCLTGITPPESMERMRSDELKKPSDLGIFLNKNVEEAILKAMAVFSENRYQNMVEFKQALYNISQPSFVTNPVPNIQTYTQSNKQYINTNPSVQNHDTAVATPINENVRTTNSNKFFDFVNRYKWIVISVCGGTFLTICIIIAVVVGMSNIANSELPVESKQSELDVKISGDLDDIDSYIKDDTLDETIDDADDQKEYGNNEQEPPIVQKKIVCERCGRYISSEPWYIPVPDDSIQFGANGETPLEYYNPDEHDYQLFISDVTWQQAEEFCESMGGHLATITCYEEIDKITEYLISIDCHRPDMPYHIWLGLYYDDYDNSWHWINGEGGGVSDWEDGEPSLVDPNTGEAENFGEMYYKADEKKWKWRDVPSDISKYRSGRIAYLCEWEHVLDEFDGVDE